MRPLGATAKLSEAERCLPSPWPDERPAVVRRSITNGRRRRFVAEINLCISQYFFFHEEAGRVGAVRLFCFASSKQYGAYKYSESDDCDEYAQCHESHLRFEFRFKKIRFHQETNEAGFLFVTWKILFVPFVVLRIATASHFFNKFFIFIVRRDLVIFYHYTMISRAYFIASYFPCANPRSFTSWSATIKRLSLQPSGVLSLYFVEFEK